MWSDAALRQTERVRDGFWQSLHYFNLYRLIVAGVILLAHLLLKEQIVIGRAAPTLFVVTSLLYILFGGVLMVTTHNRWPRFELQLSAQVLADVALVSVLMYASGGMASGLGLLLLITLAASSLVAEGRLAMFHAAVATLAVLLEQTLWAWRADGNPEYFQTGLLSLSFFAVAGLAQYLGKRLYATEELARQRGLDLANLDLVNQLIIQDMQDGVVVVDGGVGGGAGAGTGAAGESPGGTHPGAAARPPRCGDPGPLRAGGGAAFRHLAGGQRHRSSAPAGGAGAALPRAFRAGTG
jgi:hypothetical protein